MKHPKNEEQLVVKIKKQKKAFMEFTIVGTGCKILGPCLFRTYIFKEK